MTTYRSAGVDIEAGEETVERIKPMVRETFTPGVLTDIGAFGGLFELDKDRYEQPVLVSSIDGVGTKLHVAVRAGRHDTIGQDLVNHCVNDIAVSGARPLFFLDYFATGRLEPEVAVEVIRGFATACRENGCALIGGETAEMPGLYKEGDFDLAGCVVGVVERKRIVDGSKIQPGDVLLGLPSTGLHTNGYSLARKVLFEHFSVDDRPDELDGASVGEVLLAIHKSYLDPIQMLCEDDLARGFSHVTGGGLISNTMRILPDGLTLDVDWEAWTVPPIFELIARLGPVPADEMRAAFNLGIGLVCVVAPDRVDAAEAALRSAGESPVRIGRVGVA